MKKELMVLGLLLIILGCLGVLIYFELAEPGRVEVIDPGEVVDLKEDPVDLGGGLDLEPRELKFLVAKPLEIEARGLSFSRGIFSDQIRLLKDFLRAKGYENIPYGYDYDNWTRQGVIKYQEDQGLTPDGIVGEATLANINMDLKENNYRLARRLPRLNFDGPIILINKSSNSLYFFNRGRLEASYPVATGRTPNHTPTGQFKVVVKYVNPAWGGAGKYEPVPGGVANNPLGKRWIGISYGGGSKYGIHGNSNPGSIGRNVSLGCIRMFNSQVENLYERVGLGTPVWIGSEEDLIKYGLSFIEEDEEDIIKSYMSTENIRLSLFGEIIKLGKPSVNIAGLEYVPLRELVNQLGGKLDWDREEKVSILSLNKREMRLEKNSKDYLLDGRKKKFPQGPGPLLDLEGSMYIPLRPVLEDLGYRVEWRPSERLIELDYPSL